MKIKNIQYKYFIFLINMASVLTTDDKNIIKTKLTKPVGLKQLFLNVKNEMGYEINGDFGIKFQDIDSEMFEGINIKNSKIKIFLPPMDFFDQQLLEIIFLLNKFYFDISAICSIENNDKNNYKKNINNTIEILEKNLKNNPNYQVEFLIKNNSCDYDKNKVNDDSYNDFFGTYVWITATIKKDNKNFINFEAYSDDNFILKYDITDNIIITLHYKKGKIWKIDYGLKVKLYSGYLVLNFEHDNDFINQLSNEIFFEFSYDTSETILGYIDDNDSKNLYSIINDLNNIFYKIQSIFENNNLLNKLDKFPDIQFFNFNLNEDYLKLLDNNNHYLFKKFKVLSLKFPDFFENNQIKIPLININIFDNSLIFLIKTLINLYNINYKNGYSNTEKNYIKKGYNIDKDSIIKQLKKNQYEIEFLSMGLFEWTGIIKKNNKNLLGFSYHLNTLNIKYKFNDLIYISLSFSIKSMEIRNIEYFYKNQSFFMITIGDYDNNWKKDYHQINCFYYQSSLKDGAEITDGVFKKNIFNINNIIGLKEYLNKFNGMFKLLLTNV